MRRSDRPFPPAWLAAVGTAVALLLPVATAAQNRDDLNRIEGEIESQRSREAELTRKSETLAAEIAALRQKAIGAARATQDSESLLTRLERRLQQTQEELRRQEAALQKRRQQIGGTLLALERLSRNPPRALLLTPSKPMEVVRQAMLLRTSLPIIQDRAEELREGVQELTETRDDINRQLDALKGAADLYTDQHSLLDAVIEKQAALLRQTETERKRTAQRLKRLTHEAETLKELFARLEAERPAPPPAAPQPQENGRDNAQADAPPPEKQVAALTAPRPSALRPFPNRGSITLPVRGDLSRHYGESTPYGNTAKGLTFETRPAGRVVAPYDGKVVFSGPFRGYGQILIIEHSGGYHTLLSGLERVDASVGQWLLAGEPVGIMPKPDSGNPRLYFELRREGQPINPLPWFAEYRGRDRS